jgi:hypothetical protein
MKKHIYFVDINVSARNIEEVRKMIGKKANRLSMEIRDMGEDPNSNNLKKVERKLKKIAGF